jgi:uncharacterized protein (TIGR00375 family)
MEKDKKGEKMMRRFIADFHIHSKFSRATSADMEIETLALFAKKKGIDLLGTGDFTHPEWLRELKEKLTPLDNGLLRCKDTHFILTTEVANVYFEKGKTKKIHNIIFAQDFTVVERLNRVLAKFGDLTVDGRPSLSLSSKDLVEIVLNLSPQCLIIPAHIWTPWFSLFGANSGFDAVEECFGEFTEYIYGLETGLSSDPKMNWRLSSLDRFILTSNSDAHSPSRIGREANVFKGEMTYEGIVRAFKEKRSLRLTTEFFPEEGKYHYDGHRRCGVVLSPKETIARGNLCPVCERRLTIGVMHRVEELADREEGYMPGGAIPFKHLLPLEEIISEALGKGVGTLAVESEYQRLIQYFGSEFRILLDLEEEELSEFISPRILKGIMRVREGKVKIQPGYDGEYGKVKIFEEDEEDEQLALF